MKLEYNNSGRRDFRSYALLFVGLIFVWAGATVDPARNCDESGRECAPWLVPVAFCLGVFASLAGATLLIKNGRWGSKLDIQQRQLLWWDSRVSATTHSLLLDEVSRIKIRIVSDSSDNMLFYDRHNALMPIPKEEIFPYPYEAWAKDVAIHFTHIKVEVEHT